LHSGLDALRIETSPEPPPEPSGEAEARWIEACAENPRLFNGPILRYAGFDRASMTVRAARDTYQRYAMQARPPAPVTLDDPAGAVVHLAVTGVLVARDGATGRESVVLGRRGGATFVYPGMWEHAPGGGLEHADVRGQLLAELSEELGDPTRPEPAERLVFPSGAGDLLGLALDPNTPSVDIVVRLRLRPGAERRLAGGSWEYDQTRLVPVGSLGAFVAEVGGARIIPPAAAMWRALGWL
jgi:hypothetical protein